MGLGDNPAKIQDEDEEPVAKQHAAQGPEAEVADDDHDDDDDDNDYEPPRSAARYALRARGPKRVVHRKRDHVVSNRPSPQAPETSPASRKRCHTEVSGAVKKVKTETSPEADQVPQTKAEVWDPIGDDDELLVLNDTASLRTRASNVSAAILKQAASSNDGRRAEGLSDLYVELAKAKVKLLEEEIARARESRGSLGQ